MKKLFLFLFASLLSVSMFAENETGKTKADAIPYNWNTGIVVTSEPNVGKWYVVNLDMTHGGIFYDKEYIQAWNDTCAAANRIDIKKVGKTVQGNTDANITVVNPLNKKVEVDITAYIAANEYEHHYTLQADEAKSMNLGAGMLVKMGNYKVYLYLVMDVEITPAQAADMEAVHVNINEAPANSIAFVPDTFNWTGFGTTTPSEGNIIPANKEVWLYVDWNSNLTAGYTLKLHAQTTNGTATTVYGGLAMDCPATSIQEQSTELSANELASKTLDPAMLDMVPGAVYVRLQADQPLHVWATEVTEESVLPSEPLFYTEGAEKIEKNQIYQLSAESKYFVEYATLTAPEYYYMQVELTNNSDEEVTLHGKAAKVAGAKNENIGVKSAMSHDVTIGAHKTIKKEIDNTIMSNLTTADSVYAYITGGNSNISFKLVEVCTEKDPCVPANAELVTILATGEVSRAQTANTTKWYKVDVTAAKTAQTDIRMTLEADDEVTFNVDIAADCAIGEPTQSYNGTSSSSSYTIGYALFENAGDVLYVRVNCNKDMTVKAKLVDKDASITWSGSEWSNGIGPKKDKPAWIEGNLTIGGGKIIEASKLYISTGVIITVQSGGALFVGNGGVIGGQKIVVEDRGMFLISPAASAEDSKPYVEAHKTLHLGQQKAYSKADTDPYKATLPDLHEFITVPVTGAYDVEARYYYWDRVSGWLVKKSTSEDPNKACSPFVGYHVFTTSTDAHYGDYDAVFEGKLAPNKNQSFTTGQIGWYAFGNSWLAPIKLSYLLDALAEKYTSEGQTGEANQKAVHTYVTSPMQVPGLPNEGIIKDNYYIPLTAEIAANIGVTEIAPMQGFFLFTEEGRNITVDYTKVWNDATGYGNTSNAAPKHNRVADERNKAAVVFNGGGYSDFVYMIEGSATNANKMVDANLAIYAENGLGQVAKDNLIGTNLTIKTNNATEYTISFGWLNGETMYLRDLKNGVLIPMTEGNKYTFTEEPNTTSVRFQVVGRNDAPTAIENSEFIEGANKFIENGKVVIIKNGVKYNVLGAQL